MEELNEPILENDYPVYCDYLYVCDGQVIRSEIQGDVLRLKGYLKRWRNMDVKEVRRCDIIGRHKLQQSQTR